MSKLSNLQGKVQEKLLPIAGKISEQRRLSAMKEGLMATLPLTILGGLSLIIAQPPVNPAVIGPTNFFFRFLLAWREWAMANSGTLLTINNMTMGMLGLFAAVAVAYSLSGKYKMNQLSSIIISLVTFIIVAAPAGRVSQDVPGNFMSVNFLDAKGLFLAVIIGLITVEVTKFLMDKNIKIRMPEGVPPMVSAPFEALIPLFINVLLFFTVNQIMINTLGKSMPVFIMQLFQPLVSAGDSLGVVVLVAVLINILWFFGIHGGAVVNGIIIPFTTTYLAANAQAVTDGLSELPHIFAGPFFLTFVNIGGSGAALPLVIAMFLVGRSVHLKTVSKVGVVPAMFNISEPIVFSTPIIMNPFLFIPMILVPVLNAIIAYTVTSWNLVGRVYVALPFTTPGPVAAFLATMSWRTPILWFVLVGISTLIYIPFVKALDASLLVQEGQTESTGESLNA